MVSERPLSQRQQICLHALGLPVYSRRIDLPGAAPLAAWQAPVRMPHRQVAAVAVADAPAPVPFPEPAPLLPEPRQAAPMAGQTGHDEVAARFSLRFVVAGDWLLLVHLAPECDLGAAEHQLLRNILRALGHAEAEPGPLFSFPPPGNRLWQSDRRAAEDAMAGLFLRHSVAACQLLVFGEALLPWLPAAWREKAGVAPELTRLLGDAPAKRRLWQEMQACCS